MAPKVLLLYISEHSGHHCASLAIEKALKEINPAVETININSFNYTNPILEKVINKAYMGVVKRTPEIWDYLYDNPKVVKRTQKLRELIHRFNTSKLKALLEESRPDAIVCTQAFPCGMIADYKRTFNLDIALIGVLTDYAPHSYWVYNNVDRYIVPSAETGKKLVDNGIDQSKISEFGIPIDPKFMIQRDRRDIRAELGLSADKHCLLIMGGTQGLGPIKSVVRLLDGSPLEVEMMIATGTNNSLFEWLSSRRFRKKVLVFPYADNVEELMQAANVIITKPGGITTAEALASGLPMLIVNPLPGQEAMNTKFLLKEGVAVKADTPQDVPVLLGELLYNKDKLKAMGEKGRLLSKPDSAVKIAHLVLELAKK
ncbi:MAG: glycosyltransferase [Candidatus Omnitrophica bacterium]|nr:glycosyltransferase [Candidatus Omnitrophota bacterium]MCM8790136.1 glycosyltransferase [Candidatus Omnitrophota bacterium]